MAVATLLCTLVDSEVFCMCSVLVPFLVGKNRSCDFGVSLRLQYHTWFNITHFMVSVVLSDDVNVLLVNLIAIRHELSLNSIVMESCFPPGRRDFSVQRVRFAYIRGACGSGQDWQKNFAESLHTGHCSYRVRTRCCRDKVYKSKRKLGTAFCL